MSSNFAPLAQSQSPDLTKGQKRNEKILLEAENVLAIYPLHKFLVQVHYSLFQIWGEISPNQAVLGAETAETAHRGLTLGIFGLTLA